MYVDRDLVGHNFENQCLIGVRFVRCAIRRSNFSNADLSYAVFEGCDLYETKFVGAVLYTCHFRDCDATRADFSGAFLNGIRFRDTDITRTEFGSTFDVGRNRKRLALNQITGNVLHTTSGAVTGSIQSIEQQYEGVVCVGASQSYAIQFVTEGAEEQWRVWRRKSEVAKTIERLQLENGYKDKSMSAYFAFRRFETRSQQSRVRRLARVFFLEWIWGYGTSVGRPTLAWMLLVLMFTAVYAILPAYSTTSGLVLSPVGFPERPFAEGVVYWQRLSDIFVFSCQVSSLSVYGDVKPVGVAKWIALLQQVLSVVLVGAGVAAITKRIGNV